MSDRDSARGSHAFPKRLRLRKRPDFVRVQRSRARVNQPDLLAVYADGLPGETRFGLTVSKKVGNAVVRNRTKRLLRQALRTHPELRLSGLDVVFIARSSAASASAGALDAQVVTALRQIARRRAAGRR